MSIFVRDFSPIGKLNIKLGPFEALRISLLSHQKEDIYTHIILVSLQTL